MQELSTFLHKTNIHNTLYHLPIAKPERVPQVNPLSGNADCDCRIIAKLLQFAIAGRAQNVLAKSLIELYMRQPGVMHRGGKVEGTNPRQTWQCRKTKLLPKPTNENRRRSVPKPAQRFSKPVPCLIILQQSNGANSILFNIISCRSEGSRGVRGVAG